jgi:hypothetical protein
MREMIYAYKALVEKPEKKLFRRPSRRWDDNSKMDFWDVEGVCELDLSGHSKDRWWALVNMVISLWVP